jgi:outer membrane protein insertion porin family
MSFAPLNSGLRSLVLGVVISVCFLLLALHAPAQDRNVEGALVGADLLLGTLKPAAESKLQIRGAKTFKDEELRAVIGETIREIDEKGAVAARGDDAAYYLGAYYRKAGFPRVDTRYEVTGGKVIVTIEEGPRTLLRSLSFAGNKSYPEANLYPYMIGATAEELAKSPDMFPYSDAEIAAGADRVRGFYINEGFLDVTVEPSPASYSSDGTRADVILTIVEGTRYVFGDLTFTGDTPFAPKELAAAAREKADGPFSKSKAIAMQRNLESFYRSKGYFLATVELAADPKLARNGRVNVNLSVRPGALHRFDGVTVKNETKPFGRLRDTFLPARFKHIKGDIYNPETLDETYRELLRTGLFTNLRLSPTALPDNTVRLDFLVEEAKAREVGFTLGFGTYDGFKVGLRLADRNLLGSGRPLTFAADYTQRGLVSELMWFDPWFLDHHRLNFRAKIFSAAREELGYTKDETGARLEFGYKPFKRLELTIFTQGGTVEITESTIDPLLIGPPNYAYTSLGVSQTLDYRDSPIAPTRGWIFSTAVDLFLVDGEQSFTRAIGRFSYYVPVGKCGLAFGARVGAIQPATDSIPIDARFFNGGASTVRSFAERELGPKDDQNNPIGGEFYSAVNVEFTFPITGGLQGAVFADAGNLTSWNTRGFDEMRSALGIGIRYALPVGPLRIDYGINPDRRDGEDFGAFHFSFGAAF